MRNLEAPGFAFRAAWNQRPVHTHGAASRPAFTRCRDPILRGHLRLPHLAANNNQFVIWLGIISSCSLKHA
jgi:hypothetical protein